MTKAQLKRRLDKLSTEIQSIGDDVRAKWGEGCYLYFEAEGTVHAMLPENATQSIRRVSTSESQKQIIESSGYCHFDCGAW